MDLKHIKVNACPHCGSSAVRETITGTHTNGQQFESRAFECGYEVSHIPNYSQQRETGACRKSEEVVTRVAKRASTAKSLYVWLKEQDADLRFKEVVLKEAYRMADMLDSPSFTKL